MELNQKDTHKVRERVRGGGEQSKVATRCHTDSQVFQRFITGESRADIAKRVVRERERQLLVYSQASDMTSDSIH